MKAKPSMIRRLAGVLMLAFALGGLSGCGGGSSSGSSSGGISGSAS